MENKEQQILTEIRTIMASIRSQMELLDAKMAEYQQTVGAVTEDIVPIDLDIDVETEPLDAVTAQEETDGSVFGFVQESVAEPAKVTVAEPAESKLAVIDAMTARHPWRTDMPGTAVKDIRSAISLNDRIIFINYLFNEDPMIFQDALNKINQMASFEEAVDYVVSEHSDWDLGSEVVYRFMMAVRRRLR